MEWKFYDDGVVFLVLMPDIKPCTIISSFDSSQHAIKLLSNNCWIKYLGIQSAPSGNQAFQYQSFNQIAKTRVRTLDTNLFGR